MSRRNEYEVMVSSLLADLFSVSFESSLSTLGFIPTITVGGSEGTRVIEFQGQDKDESKWVMLEVRSESHDQRRIRVVSDPLNVSELVDTAVRTAVAGLLSEFAIPRGRIGKKRMSEEISKSIDQLLSRLARKK